MITKKKFQEALAICEQYCMQIEAAKQPVTRSTIGARVKLSAFGLEMQGKRKQHWRGTVVDYLPWIYPNQGSVTVKWDHIKKPDGMHESQVEPVKE